MSPELNDDSVGVVDSSVEKVEVAPGEVVEQHVVELRQTTAKRIGTGAAIVLLGLIAAVVLGGSLIAGGRSTATGVFGGAVLLTFLVTLMGVSGLSAGLQDVLEGLIIVLVISLRRGQ